MSLVLLVMTSIANATILAYEPFNYSVGGIGDGVPSTAVGTPTATTGGGFTSTWFSGGGGCSIISGLTYPGLQTTNNALQWGTAVPYQGENLATAILPAAAPSVYVSFLYNAPSYTANKAGFGLDNGASAAQGYYMGMTASGVFGVATGVDGSGSVLGTAAEAISFNTTYFIVVKFDAAGGYYKSGSIWINPTPGASEPAVSGTFTGTYSVMNKIQTFMTVGGSAVITDEVRMGTTWAEVTPVNGASPPNAPPGLQVDSVGDNTVNLSWTAATGSPTSYNVKRSASSGGPYSTVGTTTVPTVSLTDTVEGGTTYYYVVTALNAGGESAPSAQVSATPTLGTPSAPTGLLANPGDGFASLNWTASAVGSPTSYNVKRSTTSGSGYSTIGTPSGTLYTDATAANGTTYYYVVSGVNASGEGPNSAQASVTPAAFSGAYEPFNYGLGAHAHGTPTTAQGFSGNWIGAAGTIQSGLTYAGLPTSDNCISSGAQRQYEYFAQPLDAGTTWISFLMKASDNMGGNIDGIFFPNNLSTCLYFGFGFSPKTAVSGDLALGSMLTDPGGITAYGGTLRANAGEYGYGVNHLIVLKIDFNTDGDNDTVTAYVNPATVSSVPGMAPSAVLTTYDVGSITGIGINLQANVIMFLDEVRVANSYSDVVGHATTPPDAPLGLNATAGTNQVSLSWPASGGGIPATYNVKRSTSSGGPYTTVGSTTVPTVTYNDAIIGGQTYYYVVTAVNAIGESANSPQASASPIIAAPNTPGGLSAVAGDSQVSLSWSASPFATSYDVKSADDIGGPYISIGTTSGLTFDDLGLNNAQTYYYVVAAIGTGGTSSDTSPVTATPFGPLPLVLDINLGVGVTWFASNNVTYQIQQSNEDLGTNTVWSNLGSEIIGNGTTNTVFDPDAAPEDIYQVISY